MKMVTPIDSTITTASVMKVYL